MQWANAPPAPLSSPTATTAAHRSALIVSLGTTLSIIKTASSTALSATAGSASTRTTQGAPPAKRAIR
jgi:hypothetical protein